MKDDNIINVEATEVNTEEIKVEKKKASSNTALAEMKDIKEAKLAISEIPSEELVQKYGIQVIDVDSVDSIMDYGNDTLEEIGQTLISTADMTVANAERGITDLEMKKVSSFGEYLDERDKKMDKEDPRLVKFGKGVLKKFHIIKEEDEEKKYSYQKEFDEYKENLDEICKKVNLAQENSQADIQLREALMQSMLPLVEKCEAEAVVGFRSIEAYTKETEEMAKGEMTPDLETTIATRNVLAQTAASQVGENYKICASFKQTLTNFKLEQVKEVELCIAQRNFIKKSKPLLIVQGGMSVFEHNQKRRAQMMQDLADTTNEAVIKNAESITASTEKVGELMVNGTLQTSSIEKVQNAIENGYEILDKANDLLQARLANDKEFIQSVNEITERSKNRTVILANEIEKSETLSAGSGKGFAKKLGRRKYGRK